MNERSEAAKRRWANPEYRARQAEARVEANKKRSVLMRGNSNGRGNKGKKRTEAEKKAIGDFHRGKKHSEETKRKRAISMAKSDAFRYKPSKIELQAQESLTNMGYTFMSQKPFMAKDGDSIIRLVPDIYIPSLDLAIEINGCFWHNCPRCYNGEIVAPRSVANDKRKLRLLTQMISRVEVIWQHEMGAIDEIMAELISSDSYVTVIP